LALLALKKRNYQNSLLEKTHDQLWNLEQLVQSIEFAQVESRVFSGLKAGNEILKELQAEIKIEDVEQLMEDTAEAVAYQQVKHEYYLLYFTYFLKEVSQLLAGADSSLIADEDALLEELEGFIAEQENDEIILPSVPKTKVSIVEREEPVVDSEEEEIRRVGELVAE
jgi:charged multivesicular body protein 6